MVELDRRFRSLGLLPHWQWVLLQRDCGDGATHGVELESEEVREDMRERLLQHGCRTLI